MSVDYGGLENLKKRYEQAQKNFIKFIEDFLFEQGMRALRKTKLRTPVDTGTLRNGWTIDGNVKREGKNFIIYIKNPVEYASFVEYGHTKQNRIGWVDGYFMATVSIQEVQDALPRRWNAAFIKFLENPNFTGGEE